MKELENEYQPKIHARVSEQMFNQIERQVKSGKFLTKSEFVRIAVSEKLQQQIEEVSQKKFDIVQ